MSTSAWLTAGICATAAFSVAAQAADSIRYISTTGDNTNACTVAAPCRTLQRGISFTPSGGEIRILDSGEYGNGATINKSLTISGNGNTVYLGGQLTVDKAGVMVALRGLVLNGQGAVAVGISIETAAAVHIERCLIHGFAQAGIIATATGVEVSVLGSVLRDNDGNGFAIFNAGASRLAIDSSHFENNSGIGILVQSGHATITRSTASSNGSHGILLAGGVSVVVTSTVAAQNRGSGFFASGAGAMTVESSAAHGNGGSGLAVSGGAFARISNLTCIGNFRGISASGGTVETRQNNTVRGNTTNVSGALTPIGGV